MARLSAKHLAVIESVRAFHCRGLVSVVVLRPVSVSYWVAANFAFAAATLVGSNFNKPMELMPHELALVAASLGLGQSRL